MRDAGRLGVGMLGEECRLVAVDPQQRQPVAPAFGIAGEGLGDVEQSRQVLDALHVARQPQRTAGVARDQVLAGRDGFAHASTQVSLEPPPCEEFTTSEPARSATRVRPPGSTQVSRPVTANGRRSTCRGCDAVVAQRRADRQLDHRLADVVGRIGLEPGAELVQFDLAGVRADQQAIAAGLRHRLHHQFVQMASVYASPSGSAQIRVSTFGRIASSPR